MNNEFGMQLTLPTVLKCERNSAALMSFTFETHKFLLSATKQINENINTHITMGRNAKAINTFVTSTILLFITEK